VFDACPVEVDDFPVAFFDFFDGHKIGGRVTRQE
jgi:hypothetical protein